MKPFHHYLVLLLLFVSSFLKFRVVSPVTDKEILLQFKGNISSDPYNSLSSWDLSSKNPCQDYSGVFCNSDGNVEKIVLRNTSLGGVLSPALSGLKSLRVLTLFGNQFTGKIPSQYGEIETLWKINLSSNSLSGSIPDSLGDLPNIRFLDLSRNRCSGEIPPALFKNCSKTRFVSLSHNDLSGSIPESVGNCLNLLGIDLSFNNLSGGLASQICNIPGLEYLSLRRNVLAGSVREQFLSCQSLKLLDLGSNSFTGLAPFEVLRFKNLTYFNVSHNGFEGEITGTEDCSEKLQVLDASGNQLYGEIPLSIANCNTLEFLDLGFNSLNGSIPTEVGDLKGLLVIQLGNNSIGGTIPSSLGSLFQIQFLDLTNNSLSGSIPASLQNLQKLTHLNLSYNKLSGSIPSTIQRFGFFAFFHNLGLCGAPVETPCSGNGKTPESGKPKLTVVAILAIVFAAAILTGVCVITIANMKVRRRRRRDDDKLAAESAPQNSSSTDSNILLGKLVLFSKSLPSKIEDWEVGKRALLDKESLIGSGSIGTVYRATFEGGVSIAVKKLETLGRIRNQDEFEHEIRRLGNLQHPNIVAFQGYYWSSGMRLILSEFVPNGNLYDNLHGYDYPGTSTGVGNPELNWSKRFRIALGTAGALAYLHHERKPPVLHLNLKSTNILLDENYEPKLSDYGLGKLLPLFHSYGLTQFHSAVGYVAPELGLSTRLISEECDVYSFGVILLELVTGKRPVESRAENEVVILCDYVRGLMESGAASDCFDRSLKSFAENEVIQVMKLGLICTSEMPTRRPSMAEVVQILESISSRLE